ncbi:MAG TPA: hypothetical protein VGU61_22615 [Noviherbaspirillum sp.]|jgi:predicted transposase YdaD|uniref:hypothetical protein n=1 Tax=Noviherbaspirillum sp. TaxID=1926288 RepID=UPI002DDD4CB5|nr:hypothetical protein [Noviherbaspirillum sp.]HEV2613070.1 hypothetical protein [Noviherbaspirillum sp.]
MQAADARMLITACPRRHADQDQTTGAGKLLVCIAWHGAFLDPQMTAMATLATMLEETAFARDGDQETVGVRYES